MLVVKFVTYGYLLGWIHFVLVGTWIITLLPIPIILVSGSRRSFMFFLPINSRELSERISWQSTSNFEIWDMVEVFLVRSVDWGLGTTIMQMQILALTHVQYTLHYNENSVWYKLFHLFLVFRYLSPYGLCSMPVLIYKVKVLLVLGMQEM